jgi:P-type Ca2+ transporter type 2C
LFLVLVVKYGVLFHQEVDGNKKTTGEHIQEFFNILILCITVVVVAIPEGLPLAVTLSLAFATRRMMKEHNLVRHLQSCETMGNATVICSDKTGTLTQNVMTVVASAFGRGTLLADETSKLPSKETAPYSDGSTGSASSDDSTPPLRRRPLEVPLYQLHDQLPQEVQVLMKELIAINSTAFEGESDGKTTFIGSKTETALLDFAQRCFGLGNLKAERSQCKVIQHFPFDSGKKCMGVVIKKEKTYRLYIKGASEIVLGKCSHVLKEPTSNLDSTALSDDDRVRLRGVISSYASKSLRTIAMAYREFQQWPPADARTMLDSSQHAEFEDVFHGLTWISVVGIQDPVRPGVPDAIIKCEKAGVRVIMVTGDNLETAKAIAKECGILKGNGKIMQGPEFRRLSEQELESIIPKLCVLARSSPDDKKTLVNALQRNGNIVAVTGDGTNDAPALRTADVGFSMGIAGTEVAKESSDIILMDDNFTSIVRALAWGRAINDAVKKFLQFQVTVNITAVVLTFVSSVSSGFFTRHPGSESNGAISSESSVINAVQLLWVNLIMDSMGALALATDPPNDSLFARKPEPRGLPLMNHTMWKMIWMQFIFQTVCALGLYFGGPHFPLIRDWTEIQQNTLIFNVFVWSQIFNLLNCRRIDNGLNIFYAITNNKWFLGILAIMVGGQILIVFVGGAAFVVERLPWQGWLISIILGACSIPVAMLTRKLIPDWLFKFPRWLSWLSWAKLEGSGRKKPRALKKKQRDTTDDSDPRIFAQTISSKLQEQLSRGRRTNLVTHALLHPLRPRSQSSIAAAFILPGALASSLGTPADGRSIRSTSINPVGTEEV